MMACIFRQQNSAAEIIAPVFWVPEVVFFEALKKLSATFRFVGIYISMGTFYCESLQGRRSGSPSRVASLDPCSFTLRKTVNS